MSNFGATDLAVVLQSEVEGEPADALCLSARGNLQTLNDTGEALVLETGVLALRVLTDNGEVDVAVTGGETGERLAENNGRVNVELLAHCHVPGNVAGLRDRGEEDTFASSNELVQTMS